MNCKSKRDYEIVSLCDIKEFNKEIAFLKNVPWSQLTIPETLNVPKDKLSIKAICKIYIDIKINSIKTIEIPRTPISNTEGLLLTGKKLSIDGKICEKVIYSSCYPNKSLNSIQFSIPFSTYIIINHDANIYNDKFNVKACIEDVFAVPLNERTIFQSINVFLFANRISFEVTPTKPSTQIIYDRIIIINNKQKEVATLIVDLQNKILIVKSTKEIPNENLNLMEYFSMTLRSPNDFIKAFSSLQSNIDATNFYEDLNNTSFEFNDSIELKYIDNSKIFITNLENKVNKFNPIAKQETQGIQSFYITEKGILPKT